MRPRCRCPVKSGMMQTTMEAQELRPRPRQHFDDVGLQVTPMQTHRSGSRAGSFRATLGWRGKCLRFQAGSKAEEHCGGRLPTEFIKIAGSDR